MVAPLWGARRYSSPKRGNSPGPLHAFAVDGRLPVRGLGTCASRAFEQRLGARPLRASGSAGAGFVCDLLFLSPVPAFWEQVPDVREGTQSQPRTILPHGCLCDGSRRRRGALWACVAPVVRERLSHPFPRCRRSLSHHHSNSPLTICQLQARCQSVLLKCVLQ